MVPPNRKKRAARKPRSKSAKVSKPLRRAINQVVKAQVETKTINVTDPDSGLIRKNTINKVYQAAQGLQYLAQDVFKVEQGITDSTALGAQNRIGDKTRAVGFKMNYYFSPRTNYTLASAKLLVPFVKLRILVFRTAFGIPPPSYATLFNTDFVSANTSTLQPVDFHEGFVKEVLYDRVHIIRSLDMFASDSVSDPNQHQPFSNVFHFQKYIKYDRPLKYMDDQVTNPNGTDKPVYIAISAEMDDATSQMAAGTTLLYTTGYTQAWFKDA